METIIVGIILGPLEETVESILPAHVPIASLMDEIIRQIRLVYWNVEYDSSAVLYSVERQQLLQPQWTLAQCGIQESSTLILI